MNSTFLKLVEKTINKEREIMSVDLVMRKIHDYKMNTMLIKFKIHLSNYPIILESLYMQIKAHG